MIVAIGTRREPKIEAVRTVCHRLAETYPQFAVRKLISRDVHSDTAETPVTLRHLTNGARNRVVNLKRRLTEEHQEADLYIGLEGGIHTLHTPEGERAFLQSWVYAEHHGQGWYGSSGNLPLPDILAKAVLHHGQSLGAVIDEFAGKSGIRDDEGTYGILTDMQITRRASFETALLSALAPIYNRKAYADTPDQTTEGPPQ